MQIIYEPHPVSPERKAELRAAGYKIIDAAFDPAPKQAKPAPLALTEMHRADVAAALRERGLKHTGKLADLRKRLSEAE